MSTMIDITTMTPAEIRALARQREEQDKAEKARLREVERLAKIAAYPENLQLMANDARELIKVLEQFVEATESNPHLPDETRIRAMQIYQRVYFPAQNAFQGHSTAAGVNVQNFYEEGMTAEERAERDAKLAAKKAK